MAKIIPIGRIFKKQYLTQLMVKTLIAACKKQNKNEKFGQADLDGSFTVLVTRGFLDTRLITIKGRKRLSWYVTSKGIYALKKMGFNERCEIE